MKTFSCKIALFFNVLMFVVCFQIDAQNPLITNIYTADPAAHQFSDGKLYLYADYDPKGENRGWLNMFNYHVYSTSDLKIWTDHGSLFDCKDILWNNGPAWDGDCVEAYGKYWYYFPMVDKIGIAVSDKPMGPFKDALGKPFITRQTAGIRTEASGWLVSPCVIFYEGSAYIYFGQNEELYIAKLKKNMIEIEGPAVPLEKPKYFHEGLWVNYTNGKFHATYGGNDGEAPDKIGYSTADTPFGPWQFHYFVQEDKAATVQNCITEFNGRHLFFYHQNGPDDFHRQICVEEFQYTPEGNIPVIPRTKEGIGAIELRIDALGKQEAEDFQKSSNWGIETIFEPTGEGNSVVNVLNDKSWIRFEKVDFGAGVQSFETVLSSPLEVENGMIEIRLDSADGTVVGKCNIPKTGGWFIWQKVQCDISKEAKGVHNLYFVFRGETKKGFYYQINYMMDYFRFYK